MSTNTPTTTSLVQKLIAAKRAIGAVGKKEFNHTQKFNFRGIDAVINAVDPALNDAGVMTYPVRVVSEERAVGVSKSGNPINSVIVTVEYVFDDGNEKLLFVGKGESFDSGDKATAKAMSVAYRVGLIQALRLPTTDPDPDHDIYDAQPTPAAKPLSTQAQDSMDYLYQAGKRGVPVDAIMADIIGPSARPENLTEEQVQQLRNAVEARETSSS